jgi:hypothetical protein
MKYYKFYQSEKTYFEIDFNYSESCKNVYKHFTVYKNGSKSNATTIKKFCPDLPEICTASTYFWNSGRSASSRRNNEIRRQEEVENYFLSKGFSAYEVEEYIETPLAKKFEKIGVDSQGFFLEFRNEKYHTDRLTRPAIETARTKIHQRRIEKLSKKIEVKNAEKAWVTVSASLESGNCETATMRFAEQFYAQGIGAVRGDYLLKLRDDAYTRRAVAYALTHK